MALYNATNGDGWTNNSGWKTPPLAADGFAYPGTECSWFGVVCDIDQVNELNLDNNNLSGSIPAALGDLGSLRALSLSANLLTGSIPAELGSLSSLQGLYLNGNQLEGSIPPIWERCLPWSSFTSMTTCLAELCPLSWGACPF